MKTTLQLKLHQQLSITPQLQQAIRLLQLSSLELELEIRSMLESNPLLELIELEEGSTAEGEEGSVETSEDNSTRAITEEDYPTILHSWDLPATLKQDFPAQKSTEITLQQHLLSQTELAHFSQRDKIIATVLIDAISEEGYLLTPILEIKHLLESVLNNPVTLSEIESVLVRIQQFDPVGVGARTLAECLNIQLITFHSDFPHLAAAKILVHHYLELLGKRDYSRLQTHLKLDEKSLKKIIQILISLNPKPGTQISSKKSEYIVPDLLAWKKNDQIIVILNKEFTPQLRLNACYTQWIRCADNKESTQIFKQHLKEAKWFIKSLNTRHETLLKVTQCIMESQRGFLDHGEKAMQALNLQDIAQKTGLHVSTISRITTHKYILTARGIFELKYFFSNAITPSTGQQPMSTTAIRALIKKLISEEPSQNPLSDYKITTLLLEKGITIARRTVGKYREAMRIPTSNERKNLSFNERGL
jgi:RNA polymerase sigma-54 factor